MEGDGVGLRGMIVGVCIEGDSGSVEGAGVGCG